MLNLSFYPKYIDQICTWKYSENVHPRERMTIQIHEGVKRGLDLVHNKVRKQEYDEKSVNSTLNKHEQGDATKMHFIFSLLSL